MIQLSGWKAAGVVATLVAGLATSGGALAADLEGRVLRIGSDTTFPPLETIDEATGEVVGFDVDVVDAVCERVNCVPEFVTTAIRGPRNSGCSSKPVA